MKKYRFLLCLFGFLLSTTLCAQIGKLFTTNMGLPSSMVNKVFQDKRGIIWIATDDGLTSYNGAKFTTYKQNRDKEFSLVSNYVKTIADDSKGNLYVGTLTGAQLYDFATDKFLDIVLLGFNNDTVPANVTTIIERRSGDILIGTSGYGVFRLDADRNSLVARPIDLPVSSTLINLIYEDRNDYLWVGSGASNQELVCIDANNQIKKKFDAEKAVWNSISSICEDTSGILYVGSLEKGLFRYDEKIENFQHILYSRDSALPIKELYLANQNEIYIGTDGCGMKVYDIDERQIKESNFQFASFNINTSKIHSIVKDKVGNIWMGFYQKGVMLFPAITNEFRYIGRNSITNNIIGSNCVMSVFKDHEGALWVGTDNDGIYRIDSDYKKAKHYPSVRKPNSVPPTSMAIFEDSERNLWIGSYLNGMVKMDPKTGHCDYSYKLVDHESNYTKNVYCFAEDKYKRLWIGTMGGGLYYMDLKTSNIVRCKTPTTNEDFSEDSNVLQNQWVNCILVSNDKSKLYIGTYDGMACLDIETLSFVSTYKKNKLLSGRIIFSIYESHDGQIWAGSSTGLIHFDPLTGNITEYTLKNGLPNNSISAIKGDNNDNLWISTNYGMAKLNMTTKNIVCYYSGDGLLGNEFTKGTAYVDEKNNEFVFGGVDGITYFNPERIVNPYQKPEVYITDFYINNVSVKKDVKSGKYTIIDTSVMDAKEFHLSHYDNSFSIELSAMEFSNPERITYLYSFDGGAWVNLQTGLNRLSFNNLLPGKYTFSVRAKNYTSISDPKTITIIISPAWYASVWAKIIYVLIGLIILALLVMQARQRYRNHQKMLKHMHAEEINEAKLQFFMNISHEIRTPMSLIISPLRQLMNTDKDVERQKTYRLINRNSERIISLINQLMDIRKIDKGQMLLKMKEVDIVSFINDLKYTSEYQAKRKNISFNFYSDFEEFKIWIDPKNFDKIILNVLSNAFKFTPENGTVNLYLRQGNDPMASGAMKRFVEITVEDSGIGIEESEMEQIFERFYQIRNHLNNSNIGTGIGLHLVHSLVELHHGLIYVKNNEGKAGCHFVVRLPLGKDHLKPEEIDELQVYTPAMVDKDFVDNWLIDDSEVEKTRTKTSYRVLLVEDDEEIRKYICEALSDEFIMIESHNGKDALGKIQKKAPDLVISDVMMPEMDGLTLCRKIKQNIMLNHIPVVLLTAKNREEDNIEGLDTMADGYITKPFNINILRKTVQNLIKSRELLRNTFSGNQNVESQISKIEIESPDDKLLKRIMKVINQNISNQNLNVEMLANEVGISRVHLHRKLKELTNQSTRDLIRNVRLKQAALMFADKRHNVTEVANLTGFANVAYFSTAFKELYGISPTEYMDLQHKDTDDDETNV